MGENLAVRTQFTSELIALTNDLTRMCVLAHDAVARVTDGLVDADLTATYEAFALDEQLRAMHGACEARAVVLLALQAPVARDLRRVVTAIQIASELSLVGRLASEIADRVYQCHPEHVAREPILGILAAMGQLSAQSTARAGRAVAGQQPPTEAAEPMGRSMEALGHRLHSTLCERAVQQSPDTTITSALIGHHLQRCVEHTARVDRLTLFLDTGIPPTAQAHDGQ
ncbi:PhoU domain-containing protein [Nocardia sp. CNY236]|uniref:phosphate signaling complex PhoU family protein n=1 Tax=Nocardia sp. CNY236 TaxID=1169152 RepID=UPI000568B448|nr:PhoU domain-containing protein [Nocardia sp. CNY236]